MDTLYASLLTGDRWTITAELPDPKMVALATENASLKKKLKSEKNKSQKSSQPNGDGVGPYVNEEGIEVSGPPGTHGHSIPLWRSTKKGPSIVRDGAKYFWCDKHYNNKGLYMRKNASGPDRHRHDHAEWVQFNEERKAKHTKAKKEKRNKRSGDDSSVSSSTSKSDSKPSLKVKRQKTVTSLVTKLGVDHHAAIAFVNGMDDSDDSDSNVSGN